MTSTLENDDSSIHRSITGPEHLLVRMPTIKELKKLGWSEQQMQWEPEWRVPKSPHDAAKREDGNRFAGWPVDLAIFSDEDHAGSWEDILAICEFKAPTKQAGKSQLEIYLAREPRAQMGFWTNGSESIRVYRRADGTFYHSSNEGLPRPGENLAKPSEKPLTYNDLRVPTLGELKSVFKRLLDVIATRDSQTTRSEARLNQICNILLIKLESDQVGQSEPDEALTFQISSSEDVTARRIKTQFEELKSQRPQIFTDTDDEVIRLDNHSIHQAVYELSSLDLLDMSPEAFSAAFQIFRTANLKAGEGQYYTPAPVVKAAIKMMDIRTSETVIDPACGTGGFLSEAYLQIIEKAKGERGLANARSWAHRNLFGVDKDSINVKLARAILMGMNDGSANILGGDSIRKHRWDKDYPQLSLALNRAKFNVVITNPPFGQNLKVSKRDSEKNKYSIALKGGNEKDKKYHDLEIGLIFMEQSYQLLQVGGRLGIVLPETYFFSSSYNWFINWLKPRFKLRGVMNIPMEAFQGFCRAKTNFYVFERI